MQSLQGRVALVTGASRGVGRGIALGLGEAGASVYVTARTTAPGGGSPPPGTIEHVAAELTDRGGRGIAVGCDHRDDDQVERLFQQIRDDQGHLDLLVNNVWGGYERMVEDGVFTWEQPFWLQPAWRWDAMFAAGVRAHYLASREAAKTMVERRDGLIVSISYWAAQKYMANVVYGVAKIATDRMVADMAHELREHNVAAVSLYPGLVRTEAVMQAAEQFDLSNSESPQFLGRVVAALAADPAVMDKSGRVLAAAELAQEYGVRDLDGRQPRPLRLDLA